MLTKRDFTLNGFFTLFSRASRANKASYVRQAPMPLGARRVFRLSFAMALSLSIAYAIAAPLPYMAPIFTLLLGLKPGAPIGIKALVSLLLVVLLTMTLGLLLVPLLTYYAFSGVLLVAVGLYFSSYLTVIKGKALIGMLLSIGFTLISIAGVASYPLALMVIHSLLSAIVITVLCQWLIYPWFPEDLVDRNKPEQAVKNNQSNWIAIRATIIILPAYLLALTNPALYMPIILKTVLLAQESSTMSAKEAARELLSSTFVGGCFAILAWSILGILTTLPMYACLMLIFAIYCVGKIYGIFSSNYPASYWQNAFITFIILIGSTVEDSANGTDVYTAFIIRITLFFAVTLYACFAVFILEQWRQARLGSILSSGSNPR